MSVGVLGAKNGGDAYIVDYIVFEKDYLRKRNGRNNDIT